MVVKLPCERKHEFQIMHCIVGFAARSRGFYLPSPRRLIQLYRGFPCFANQNNMQYIT